MKPPADRPRPVTGRPDPIRPDPIRPDPGAPPMRDHFRKLRGRTVSMRDVVTEAREGIESSSDIERDELLTAFLTTCYPARVSQDA